MPGPRGDLANPGQVSRDISSGNIANSPAEENIGLWC